MCVVTWLLLALALVFGALTVWHLGRLRGLCDADDFRSRDGEP